MTLQESFVKQGNFLFRYRSYLPLILVGAGMGVFVINSLYGKIPTDLQYFSLEVASLIIALMGLLIRIITVGHTPADTSGRNTKEQIAGEVNTTGIYSVVRHLFISVIFEVGGCCHLVANILCHLCWFTGSNTSRSYAQKNNFTK